MRAEGLTLDYRLASLTSLGTWTLRINIREKVRRAVERVVTDGKYKTCRYIFEYMYMPGIY